MPTASPSLQVRYVTALCLFITGCYPLSSGHADGIPECPNGFFRNALLVFPCKSDSVERSYMVTAVLTVNQTEFVGTIPSGVKSLVIATKSPIPVWLELFNADAWDLDNYTGTRYKDLLGYDGEGVTEFTFSDITVSTEVAMGDPSLERPYSERVTFFGSPPMDLLAAMKYNDTIHSEARVALAYRYNGFVDSNCTRPVGCATYHPRESAAILTKFSMWIDAQFDGLNTQAFADLNVMSLLEKNGFLHFHDWPRIWARWPSGGEYPWQASFNLVDSLINRDGLVSKAELEKVFSFHRVYPSLSTWSGILHGARNAQTADQAWKSLHDGDDSLSMAAWISEWELWPAPQGLEKVSGESSFDYIDDDGDGRISQDEFRVAYDVFYMGLPIFLQEIHERSPALAASPLVSPRTKVMAIAASSPSFNSTNNTENETNISTKMNASTSVASGGPAHASSGRSDGWFAAAIVASIVAVAITGAITLVLGMVMMFRVQRGRLLSKEKRHSLSVGPSESRLSRELRAQRDPAQYEPVIVSGDHSSEAGPPPHPERQLGQQDPLMHEVTQLQMALNQDAVIPTSAAHSAQHFLQSPMGTTSSPMASALMHPYAAVPGQASHQFMPHLTAQPSPQQFQLQSAVDGQREASRGYAYVHYPHPQWYSSTFNQFAPVASEPSANVLY